MRPKLYIYGRKPASEAERRRKIFLAAEMVGQGASRAEAARVCGIEVRSLRRLLAKMAGDAAENAALERIALEIELD